MESIRCNSQLIIIDLIWYQLLIIINLLVELILAWTPLEFRISNEFSPGHHHGDSQQQSSIQLFRIDRLERQINLFTFILDEWMQTKSKSFFSKSMWTP